MTLGLLSWLAWACIVDPSDEDDTGIEPDVDTDVDSDTDTDSDTDVDTDTATEDDPWHANAVSFNFSSAIIGGEMLDGAVLAGKSYDATFSVSLMSTTSSNIQNCNVQYLVAGATAASSSHFDADEYWAAWDFSTFPIDELTGDCDSLVTVFGQGFDDLEVLLASYQMEMGIKNIAELAPDTRADWSENWGFGDWEEDEPYLAAGALFVKPFNAAYEMNVFQAYEIDPETLEIAWDGTTLNALPLRKLDELPDGFFQSSPMYIIGTSW